MLKRRLGRTGHESSVIIMGTAALWNIDQAGANDALDFVTEHGVNHIDVAPQYGNAQSVVGPWLESRRDAFFLGCKTLERERDAAWADLQNSLKLLRTDAVDLYQFHGVATFETLDTITGDGGAFETFTRARDEGLTRFLGITSHGMDAPKVALEAVKRMRLDTVMVPLNPRLYADEVYHTDLVRLLDYCQAQDVGVQIIKHAAKRPWPEEKKLNSWYEPYVDQDALNASVSFALSQPGVACLASPGDVSLLPNIVEAAARYEPMSEADQNALIAARADDPIIFHGPQLLSK